MVKLTCILLVAIQRAQIFLSAAFLTACSMFPQANNIDSAPSTSDHLQLALLSKGESTSRNTSTTAVLAQGVAELMGIKAVRLADDAFVRQSRLTLERKMPSAFDGRSMNDRLLASGEVIELLTPADHPGICYLREKKTNQLLKLKNVSCQLANE